MPDGIPNKYQDREAINFRRIKSYYRNSSKQYHNNKNDKMYFFKFLQQQVSRLDTKKYPALFQSLLMFCHMIFANYKPQSHPKLRRTCFFKPGKLFLWKFKKRKCHF